MNKNSILWIGIFFVFLGGLAVILVKKPWQNAEKIYPPQKTPTAITTTAPEYSAVPVVTPQVFQNSAPQVQGSSDFLALAEKFEKKGMFSEAIMASQKVIAQNPKNIRALQILKNSSLQLQNFPQAEEFAKLLLRQTKSTLDTLGYIEVLLLSGKVDDAAPLITALPRSVEKVFYQLIVAIVKEDHTQIKKLAQELQNSSVKKYQQTGKNILAIYTTYESFKDGSPHYLRTMLANMLNILQFHNLVVEFLPKTLREYPDYRDAWILMGNSYLNLKKFKLASDILDKAVSLDPTHDKSPYYLGIALAEQGQNQPAIEQFEAALLNGYTPVSKVERYIGDIYFRQKKFDNAFSHYQIVLDQNDAKIQDYQHAIFIALSEQNSPDLGLKLATQAVTKFSKSADSFVLLGWALYKKKSFDSAITALKKAENLDPNLAEIFLYYGKTFEAQKKNQESFLAYKKCYELGQGTVLATDCATNYNALQARLQHK